MDSTSTSLILYSASLDTTSSPRRRRESSEVSSENSCFFSSSKESLGGTLDSLYSKSSVCFSCSTLLLVSIAGFGFITSAGLICSFTFVLTITFSCLSIFSCLSFCLSFIEAKKSDNLSPRFEPEDKRSSCNLLIKAAHDTSRESVKPNKRVDVNNNKLPMKLRGTINIEEI